MNDRIILTFAGDISLADSLFCQGFGVRSTINKKGADYLFSETSAILKQSQLVFANLETILSNDGLNANHLSSMDMRGRPSSARALKNAGISVLNLANNHSMQHGPNAFRETCILLNKYGIEQIGIKSEDSVWQCRPTIIDIKNTLIGFLGYSFEVDRYATAPLYAEGKHNQIKNDIIKLKKQVDLLIISAHWGLENINIPSILTINRAHEYIDCGADLIIGHHPHVVQGMEKYKEKFIFYSLGNFIFDMNWSQRFRKSILCNIEIDNKNIRSYQIIPVFIDKTFRPTPLKNQNEIDSFLKYFDKLSQCITKSFKEDPEKYSLTYYDIFKKELRKQRYLSYLYFIHNFYKYNKRYLPSQFSYTIKSKIEDIAKKVKQEVI